MSWSPLIFFHLDKSKGRYEYVLLIVDQFTSYAQAYAHVTKQPVLLQKNFLMRLSQDLGFQLEFITIKVESFKTSCSIIWRVSVESSVPEWCRTTRKVMARWNAWIERCRRNRKRLGKTHLISLFTPTIAWSMNRQATPHSNYCLAVPLDYQLIQLIFDLDNSSEAVGYPTYVSEWQRDMKRSYSLESHHTGKSSTRSKEFYDRKAHSRVPQPGVFCPKEGDQGSFVHIGKNRYTSLRNE